MSLDLSRLNNITKEIMQEDYKSPAQAKKDEIKEIYSTHQDNIGRSETIQAEILKGIRAGENIYTLFLKASKAITLMTGNTVFYNQIEADIIAIQGKGLLEPQPLRVDMQAAEQRLIKLKEALEREEETDTKERIRKAIKAHENKIAQLSDAINKSSNES